MGSGVTGGPHHRDRPRRDRRASSSDRRQTTAADDPIEVFATGETEATWQRPPASDTAMDAPVDGPGDGGRAGAPPPRRPAGLQQLHPGRDPGHDDPRADGGHDRGRHYHARPGHRPGGAPSSSRSGGEADIVRPLLLDPQTASEIALLGEMFREPIPHLRVLPGTADEHDLLVWAVEVVAAHERAVPATLHLLGSPSMVVTVLELVPARRLRFGRQRFVRYGIEAVDAIAARILDAAA